MRTKANIAAFDAETLKVKNTWSLAPGESPSGLTIDRRNRRLFSVCSNEKMMIMDADSGKIVAAPVIGNGPDAAAFHPRTGLAFSSNGQDGTLTVVHEDSPNQFSVVQTLPTQISARTMALDPKTQQYLPCGRALSSTARRTGSPNHDPGPTPPSQCGADIRP